MYYAALIFIFVSVLGLLGAIQPIPSQRQAGQRGHNGNSTGLFPAHWSSWMPGQIDYRLTRLEVQVGEKIENLRVEMREGTRKLQSLEWQSGETHTALEGLKSEVGRLTQQLALTATSPHGESSTVEERIDKLAKGIQVIAAAVTILNADMANMKDNISSILNNTSSILQETKQFVTKQYFNNGVIELKHDQLRRNTKYESYSSSKAPISLPTSCRDMSDTKESGIYRIQPEHSPKSIMVLCDMETRNGGWTVIHNRYEGSQDFNQNWHEYKHGFGNLGGEFWLGLENLYQLTGHEVNELLIELEDFDLETRYSHYAAFSIGSELEGYSLKILARYSGDGGDSLIYHAGSKFSTKDMDQDAWTEGSCAKSHGGAWWYRGCDTSNLNGKYLSGELPEQYVYQGMYWGEFRGAQYSLFRSRMMIRPRNILSPPIFTDTIKFKLNNSSSLLQDRTEPFDGNI